MRVLVTGGTGFVGTHVVSRLLRDRHAVTVLVRRPNRSAIASDQLQVLPGDVVENLGIDGALEGQDAVIHLVGIIVEKVKASFERVHYQGTCNMISAAKRAAIPRFIHMSAFGARLNGVSAYQRSKFKAEEEVRNSGIPFTVLRPSLIFGPGDGFVSQMTKVMKSVPLIRPVPGTGRYPFTPVYVDDVADCFLQSLTNPVATNKTVDLGGSERLTLEEILTKIASCLGVDKPAIHIPMPLMYFAAALASILPNSPVTRDQLRMLQEGSVVDIGPMKTVFRINPVTFTEGLKRYLCP